MDAITLLKNDHKAAARLFREFERAGPTTDRQSVVDSIIETLSVHTAIEEGVFYPAARREASETLADVFEGLEEHHVVKWLLLELSELDPSDDRFNAKTKVVIEFVRHHVEEEETEFFPKLRKALGRKRLLELGAELEAAKVTAPGFPQVSAKMSPQGR
jgi:hemerythrin-like domain-containing protein